MPISWKRADVLMMKLEMCWQRSTISFHVVEIENNEGNREKTSFSVKLCWLVENIIQTGICCYLYYAVNAHRKRKGNSLRVWGVSVMQWGAFFTFIYFFISQNVILYNRNAIHIHISNQKKLEEMTRKFLTPVDLSKALTYSQRKKLNRINSSFEMIHYEAFFFLHILNL